MLLRTRAYACWMPLSSRMLVAADACEHPAGLLRGLETYCAPSGNLLTCAASMEVETVALVASRVYATIGVAVPSVQAARVGESCLAFNVGYSIVPRRQRMLSRFADVVIPREFECSFPWFARVWQLGRSGGAAEALNDDALARLVVPACRIVWGPADADHAN